MCCDLLSYLMIIQFIDWYFTNTQQSSHVFMPHNIFKDQIAVKTIVLNHKCICDKVFFILIFNCKNSFTFLGRRCFLDESNLATKFQIINYQSVQNPSPFLSSIIDCALAVMFLQLDFSFISYNWKVYNTIT